MSWAWIEIERRYTNAGHAPDWTAEDRPPWTLHNEAHKRTFAAWVSRQLDEFARRVRAERIAEIEADPAVPEALRLIVEGLKAGVPALTEKVEAIRMAKPNATINDIAEMERLQEIRNATGWKGGAGRPASGTNASTPAAQAARDIWRVRRVILPRFWPEGAKPGLGLTNKELAAIVAARHPGTTADAALHWYERERLASL